MDYLGIIAAILTAIFVYKKFKSGWFSKQQQSKGEETKSPSRFQRWWTQSYIREIYVVRASQRKSACFIPWAGVAISAFFVYWFSIGMYLGLVHPDQPFEKLTRYNGVVKGYVYHRKSNDILIVQLPNSEKKYFHMLLRKKEVMETWMDKNVTVWAQQDWGVLEGNYEEVQAIDLNGVTVLGSKTYDSNVRNQKHVHDSISGLLHSLAWIFGFLVLLWIINRNPVSVPAITNNKNQPKG